MISYFGACRHQYIMVQGMPLFGPQVACCDLGTPAVCVWQIFRVWHVAWQVLFDQQSPRDRDCNCKKDKKRNTTPMLPNTSELVGCPILPGRSCPKMSQVAIDSPSTTWWCFTHLLCCSGCGLEICFFTNGSTRSLSIQQMFFLIWIKNSTLYCGWNNFSLQVYLFASRTMPLSRANLRYVGLWTSLKSS